MNTPLLRGTGFAMLLLLLPAGAASDWPQWRGPQRDGRLIESSPLADHWPASGIKKLWDSEEIPSDDNGGFSSPIAAGGKVYVSIVWHRDVPSETRAIDDIVMRQLGYQSVAGWPKDIVANMEKTRRELDPNLMGAEYDKFVQDWLDKNLDAKKRQTSAGFVRGRFNRRGDAIPLEVYDKLLTVSKKRFPSQAAMEEWVNAQGFGEKLAKEIIAAVPPTMRVADDVVLCLDLATGKTLWKFSAPGEAVGRNASSTPCIADGKIYALGSTNCYAVDAQTGKQVWAAPLPLKGPASSPLIAEGVFVVNAGKLVAFDAATGKQLWTQPKAGGGNASPVAWKCGEKSVVICNGKALAGVDLKTGALLWSVPAGGDCTPALAGDRLAVQTSNAKVGIMAGKLTATNFVQSWNLPYDPLRSQSSPLIVDGHLYLMDDNFHWCLELATGKQLWKEKVPSSTITSPVLADGKAYLLVNGGAKIMMMKLAPEKRIELGLANVRGALGVPSPAIADGKLILRGRKGISCFRLTANVP
jgi:outer membrane protein assembly factor BamB